MAILRKNPWWTKSGELGREKKKFKGKKFNLPEHYEVKGDYFGGRPSGVLHDTRCSAGHSPSVYMDYDGNWRYHWWDPFNEDKEYQLVDFDP